MRPVISLALNTAQEGRFGGEIAHPLGVSAGISKCVEFGL